VQPQNSPDPALLAPLGAGIVNHTAVESRAFKPYCFRSWRVGVRRRRERPCTQPRRSRNIHRDLIVEKLEIARTIGLVTDYAVGPVEPSRQLEACVTVRRSSAADDAGVKQYLANLLDGAVAVENIMVTSPSAAGSSKGEPVSQQDPQRSMDEVRPMRSALFSRTSHPHMLATAGAMLTCAAVVLNVGPFAIASRSSDPASNMVVQVAPPATPPTYELASSSQPELAAPVLASFEPPESTRDIPESLRALMQPPPFAQVELVAVAAAEPDNAADAGGGIDRPDLVPAAVVAQAGPDRASAEGPTVAGVWAPDAGTCSARDFREGMLPTVISQDGAWAGDTFCMFTKRRETENGWTAVAKCSTPHERWTSNVHLTVTDNRLTWTSKRGTQAYTRCRPDMLMAQAR